VHNVSGDLRLSLIDAGAVIIAYGDRAERRFQVLGEPERKLPGRGRNAAPDARLGTIQKRMGFGGDPCTHDDEGG
jgi:hypothetical protein